MIIPALVKEFRLLRRDLHGMAVLFLMPMVFMLIMSVALSNADNVNDDLNIALVGAVDNELNGLFAEALAEQQQIHAKQLPLEDTEQVIHALINGDYDMVMINLNKQQKELADDQNIELHVLASTDRTRIIGLKGIIQKVYIQQRLNFYFDQLPKADNTSMPNNTPPGNTLSPDQPLPTDSASAKNIGNTEVDKNAQPALNSSSPENMATAPDFDAINSYLKDDLISEIYINIQGNTVNKPSSVQQSVPAWLIFGMFFIMIPLSNVMATEKQTNTITRLRLAKASAFSLLLAKLLPYFLINQLQFWGMILLGIYALPLLGITGFELHGSYWNYVLLSCAISLSALGYALLVSVLAKSTEHAVVLGGGGNIIMAAIGGIMVPSYVMPDVMQDIALISPMSWALRGFHDLLLNQYSFEQILPQWLSLIGFAVAFLLLAYILYCKQLKQQVRL